MPMHVVEAHFSIRCVLDLEAILTMCPGDDSDINMEHWLQPTQSLSAAGLDDMSRVRDYTCM